MKTINNNITEDYCSFELSKLLKEKGFWRIETFWFDSDGKEVYWTEIQGNFLDVGIPRPSHALAIKWIRENYRWNIKVGYKNVSHSFIAMVYPINPNRQVHPCGQYKSQEEAAEAALLYTLKNLI